MLKINDIETTENVILFLKDFKTFQKKYSNSENVCYPKISLYFAMKNGLFFSNFLLHPLIISIEPFYETKTQKTEDEILALIVSVLEFELTEEKSFLTSEELKKVINVHKKLVRKQKLKQKKASNEKSTA